MRGLRLYRRCCDLPLSFPSRQPSNERLSRPSPLPPGALFFGLTHQFPARFTDPSVDGFLVGGEVLTQRSSTTRKGPSMAQTEVATLSDLFSKHEARLLADWMRSQLDAGSLRSGQIKEDEVKDQCRRFLREFVQALKLGEVEDITGQQWSTTRVSERGAFPPQQLLPKCSSRNLPYPKVIDPEAPPLGPERHVPNSIPTLRRRLIIELVANLSRCPCCAAKTQRRLRSNL